MPHGTTLLFSEELDPLATKGEMTSRPLQTVPTARFDLHGTNELTAAVVARLWAGDNGRLGSQCHTGPGCSVLGTPSPSCQLGLTPGLLSRSFFTSDEYHVIKFIKGCRRNVV